MHTTAPSLLGQLRHTADQKAWNRFVQLYTPLLFHWVRRLNLREQDAADLVQDVLLTLVQKLPEFKYDPHKSFRAWLRTILMNKWRNRCAALAAARVKSGNDDLPEPALADNVAELGEEEYRQQLVARALELMQAEFQPTTWKACWELVVRDRPAGEVAAELGVSTNAVYLAKSRVLARLREELEGLLD
jgi:RNA polymerase sigma-70 factor (ECF subfamily)